MNKLILMLCMICCATVFAKQPKIITVKSVEVGDYCWLTTKAEKSKTYLVDVAENKNMCQSGDSAVETKLWKGKKLKITTKMTQICEHLPPCEKGDKMIDQDSVVDFDVIK